MLLPIKQVHGAWCCPFCSSTAPSEILIDCLNIIQIDKKKKIKELQSIIHFRVTPGVAESLLYYIAEL